MLTTSPARSTIVPSLITIAILTLIVATGPATAQVEFEYAGTIGDRLYFISDTELTWAEAREICAAQGGHLVTIADEAENELVRGATLLRDGSDVWIGCTDELIEGEWVWVDGSLFGYTNWADYGDAFEPDNNGGVEHYGLMWGDAFSDPANRGSWADVAADVYAYAVLEREIPDLQLEARTLGPNEVRLDWTIDGPAPDSVLIERKEGLHGAWELVQTVPGETVDWTDGTVTQGLDYYYRVKSQDGPSPTGTSNYSTTTPGFVPNAPSNIAGQIITPFHVRLTWQDNSLNEVGFLIQRKTGEFGTWQYAAPQPAGTTQYDDTVANSETDYQYRVLAYNQNGKSAWATTTIVSTPTDTTNFDASISVLRGLLPCKQANVYVDKGDTNGFVHVGNTDASGYLLLTGLSLGDQVRAVWYAKTWPNCRDYQSDSSYTMGLHLVMDTDVGPNAQGNYQPFRINTVQTGYTLQVKHAVYVYDLALSIGRNLATNDPLWDQVFEACQQASNYLYDVSDGQMAFGRMLIYDNWLSWNDVDVILEQADITAHTELDQYDDCDTYSKDEHIFMFGAAGTPPNHPSNRWHRTLVHEFGHYELDLKDEYENGWGSVDYMNMLKKTQPNLYPQEYGVMDGRSSSDEFSSFNDYTFGYNYAPCSGFLCGIFKTEQLYKRGKPCWEQIEQRLEGYSSLVNIIPPPTGWFINGASSSNDRAAPTRFWDDIRGQHINGVPDPAPNYPQLTFEFVDSGDANVSFLTDVVVEDERGRVPGARIYRLGSRGIEYIGRTDDTGILARAALEPGDEIRSYGRRSRGTIRATLPDVGIDKAGGTLLLKAARGVSKNGTDTTAPGAAVDLLVHGSTDAPWLDMRLWFDEPLISEPEVFAYFGSSPGPVPVTWNAGEEHYQCELILDPDDPLFIGEGVFEVAATDTADNLTVFTADFTVHETTVDNHVEIYQGNSVLNVPEEGITVEQQPAVSVACNAVPYGTVGSGLTPVASMYGAHLAAEDFFAHPTGFNVEYADSLLEGLDESMLAMFRWDADGRAWAPLAEYGVSPSVNTVSGYVEEGGLFAVFGTGVSDDVTPPGAVGDLGAVGIEGAGTARLFWTAPGDDDQTGTVEQYILAYDTEPFAEDSWDALDQITIPVVPETAGTEQIATVRLPVEGGLYHVALRAKDEASLLGPMSNMTLVTSGTPDNNLLPGPPTDVRAVDVPGDAGDAVNLSWLPSHDDGGGKGTVVEYHVYRTEPGLPAPELIASLPAGTVGWTDHGVESATTYTYHVSAADSVNQALGAENKALPAANIGVPPGDFTTDGIVGVNDLSHLVDHYGLAEVDAEFDPLFDLNTDNEIYLADVDHLADHFGTGGVAPDDPAAANVGATVQYELAHQSDDIWLAILTVEGAVDLAGFSCLVTFGPESTFLADVGPGDGGGEPGFLSINGGETPVFMVAEPSPGEVRIAQVIQEPSVWSAPDGGGVLAHLLFSTDSRPGIIVRDLVLMDHEKKMNFKGRPSAVDSDLPRRTVLYQNSPNPFNPRTTLKFATAERGPVELAIFDLRGRLVRELVDETLLAGNHEVVWDGRTEKDEPVASGVYLYRLKTKGYEKSRKMVLLR